MRRTYRSLLPAALILLCGLLASCLSSGPEKPLGAMADAMEKNDSAAFLAQMDQDYLADLLIVSQVSVTVGDALSVAVAQAQGEKCERCWKHHIKVGDHADHPSLCPRCAKVMAALPLD